MCDDQGRSEQMRIPRLASNSSISSVLTHGFIVCLLVATLFGCASQDVELNPSRVTGASNLLFDHYKIYRTRSFILPSDARLLVAKPVVAKPLLKQFPKLSSEIQMAQLEALQTRFPVVNGTRQAVSLDVALRQAKNKNQQFLVYPTVSVWHQTQLAKKLNCSDEKVDIHTPKGISQISTITQCDWEFAVPYDKIHLAIWVYDVASGKQLDTLSIYSKSGILTFFGDEPATLVTAPLNEVANLLSGR